MNGIVSPSKLVLSAKGAAPYQPGANAPGKVLKDEMRAEGPFYLGAAGFNDGTGLQPF